MFNNNKDDEADFCESYKSQILGTKQDKKEKSLFGTIGKLLIILILFVTIIGISFYGYNYFKNSQKLNNIALPPISSQVSDDDLVVTAQDPIVVEVMKKENISIPLVVTSQLEEDIDKIANDVKIAISKSELKEENESKIDEKIVEELSSLNKEESLDIPTSAPEAQYLEELADLSKEIDKERNQ